MYQVLILYFSSHFLARTVHDQLILLVLPRFKSSSNDTVSRPPKAPLLLLDMTPPTLVLMIAIIDWFAVHHLMSLYLASLVATISMPAGPLVRFYTPTGAYEFPEDFLLDT